jgi:hypothetical protein
MKTLNVGEMELRNVGQSRLKTLFHYSNAPVEKMFWLIFAALLALCSSVQAQRPSNHGQSYASGGRIENLPSIRLICGWAI